MTPPPDAAGTPQAPAPIDARSDWIERVGIRRTLEEGEAARSLPPPSAVTAESGRAQVTLRWSPVSGAQGYLIHRADPDGSFSPLDHGGGDVLATPGAVYTDTTGEPGRSYRYTVSSVSTIEAPVGRLSMVVVAASNDPAAPSATVEIGVDADLPTGRLERPWRPMIGAEHLAIMDHGTWHHRRPVGPEFMAALELARDELGVRAVRAHAILHDELGVYREVRGRPVHDFTRVDSIYDRLLGLGLRPIVELSFVPHDLAADPSRTVFDYGAIVSPPRDWRRWSELVADLTGHLVGRYGLTEVRDRWAFEVWNEPNLEVFWSGSRDDYMRLYDASASAVRSVDAGLRVGGPSTAAAGWIGALLEHVADSGAPLDFLSTHTYGNPPLDVRATAELHGRPDLPAWWTEWGVTPIHFAPVNDAVFGAPFICRSMKQVHGRVAALAYWVVSDHFEELGRPERLFHGGFGLLTIGNLRKPRWWALRMLESLGDQLIECAVSGDGAGGLVDAIATRGSDGRVSVLVWNGTLDQSKVDGHTALDRDVTVRIGGLGEAERELRHRRVDATHSNIRAAWQELDGRDAWPRDDTVWRALAERDRLEDLEPQRRVRPQRGVLRLSFPLPMPGVSLLELLPGR